jgi:hypothetical protein
MKTTLYKKENNALYFYGLMSTGKSSLIEIKGKFNLDALNKIIEYNELDDLDTFYYSKVRENLSEYNERINYLTYIVGVKIKGGVTEANSLLFLSILDDFNNDLWLTGNGNIPESYYDYKKQKEYNSMEVKDEMYITIVKAIDIKFAVDLLKKRFKENFESIMILEENI